MNNSKIIKLVLSLALQTTLFCFLANIASGQTTDVSNLTYDEFKKKLDDLGKQGFRPVKIWSKPLGTFDSASAKPGYWAKLEKVRGGIPWAARFGKNAEHYQQEFEKFTAQGLTPMDVNVSCVGSQPLYCGIFEKLPNAPACIARHNIDNATFQKQNATCTQQGYKLKVKSSCNGVYAAIWQK
jgi:hypothetical protein